MTGKPGTVPAAISQARSFPGQSRPLFLSLGAFNPSTLC